MTNIHLEVLLLLFFVAFFAGYLDTLAGGGGLITLPSLMLAGLPITAALGTNKLQSSFGSITATLVLLRNKKIDLRIIRWPLLMAFLGGMVGAISVIWIDKASLHWLVPSALVVIIIYFLFAKQGEHSSESSATKIWIHTYLVSPLIGFYDGFLGPGTGSFFTASNLYFRALNFVSAIGYAKPLNAATNVAALLIFIFTDSIHWLAGIVMIFGQIVGSYLAAKRLHLYSARSLRRLVVCVSFVLLTSYLIREFL
ncbi:MAG: TSUP family transporter [Pseudomonadota bacterium]